MLDALLAESTSMGRVHFEMVLCDISRIFGISCIDLWEEYREGRGFTELHRILLHLDDRTLDAYLEDKIAPNTLSSIIDTPDGLGRSALYWAVEHCLDMAVPVLINSGADVNRRSRLPLSMAPSLPLLHLALAGPASSQRNAKYLQIIRFLLHGGADVNTVDHEGWTPLHVCGEI